MAGHVSGSPTGGRTGRLPRGTLSRAGIVEAALAVLDQEHPEGLTFSLLGKVLGCTPPAIYRHFESREAVLVEVTEEIIRRAFVGFEPGDDWLGTLDGVARRTRQMGQEHPAAVAMTMVTHTGGASELFVVDVLLAAVHEAGWTGRAAVLEYRAFADFILAITTASASRCLAERTVGRVPAWIQEYGPGDLVSFPTAASVREELATVDLDEIWNHQLETYLASMRLRAPSSR